MSVTLETSIVSLGAGLIVLAIGLLIKRVPKPVSLLMAVGIGLIAFVLWPRTTLVEMPDLSDLSRDEAELRLSSLKLIASPQPQEAPNTLPGHVVPVSQLPLQGTKVRPGAIVRYSISTPTSIPPGLFDNKGGSTGSVSIFSPRNGDNVMPRRGADNLFRFDVEGTVEGVDFANSSLLLWVRPIEPPSEQPGWYLQRLPANGIRSVSGNIWRGVCQIGNQHYPPQEGDVVELAATTVSTEKAALLEARQGLLTTVVLPGIVSSVVRVTVNLN